MGGDDGRVSGVDVRLGYVGFLCNMVQMGREVVKEVDMWKDMRKRRIERERVIWRGTMKRDKGGYGMAECKTIE